MDESQKMLISQDQTCSPLESPDETQEPISDQGKPFSNQSINSSSPSPLRLQEETLEPASDLGQPPTSNRIEALRTQLQILKKEHTVLSEEAKGMTELFPGSEICSALLLLGSDYESLKKKYLEECAERKRLYNEVIELKGNIRVFCRCRPLSSEEQAKGSSSVVEFDPAQETELKVLCSDSSKKQFKFDHVFGPQDDQEAVFSQTGPIVISVLDGYNVCIFAYGQTGTGKTFTMEGTPDNRGVNYRTLEELFRIAKERNLTMKYELSVSMLEVYNEKIRDLLLVEDSQQPSKKLEIKQASDGAQEIVGLVETQVYSTEEVWELLKRGNRARAVGSTNANELSSRSHCLVRVTVKGSSLVKYNIKSKSQLWLVDLAGSERLGKIDVEGERLKESQCINKSLSALGDVISALSTKTPHIPYRNSKLTHLLQTSLGGDCKTLMFVQISPSAWDLGETLCSLNFASRVRGIEYGPARKQLDHLEFFKYKQMAEKQKQDEKEARKILESLQSLQLKFTARENLCRNLQEKLKELETQLADERKSRLQQENRAATTTNGQQQKGLVVGKPPLFPFKPLRPPLSRDITNIIANPSSRYRRNSSSISVSVTPEKENTVVSPPSTKLNLLMKARRVSIASMATSTEPQPMQQPKRKISITPHDARRFFAQINGAGGDGEEAQTTNPSKLLKLSRRPPPPRARHSFVPRMSLPLTKVAAAIHDSKHSKDGNNGRSQYIRSWEPKLPTVASPRVRRFMSSPVSLRGLKNAQALNKFCSSVQKKVVSSPRRAQQQVICNHPISPQIQQSRGTGKLGSARRIVWNGNATRRRASVQPLLPPASNPL